MSMSVHKVRNASTNHSLAITNRNNLAESRCERLIILKHNLTYSLYLLLFLRAHPPRAHISPVIQDTATFALFSNKLPLLKVTS